MRRIAIGMVLLFALSLLGASVSAQGSPMKFGIKGGLAMTKWGGDHASFGPLSPDNKMGLVFGIFGARDFSPNFGVQAEALYAMMGTKYELEGNKLTIKLNYIQIPVFLIGKAPMESGFTPYGFLGPVLAINMSAKAKEEIDGMEDEEDMDELIKSTDFGLAFGGGAAFDMSGTSIFFEGRYYMGMSSISEFEGEDIKNKGFMFMAGVGF